MTLPAHILAALQRRPIHATISDPQQPEAKPDEQPAAIPQGWDSVGTNCPGSPGQPEPNALETASPEAKPDEQPEPQPEPLMSAAKVKAKRKRSKRTSPVVPTREPTDYPGERTDPQDFPEVETHSFDSPEAIARDDDDQTSAGDHAFSLQPVDPDLL